MPATSPHVPAPSEPTTHDLGETLGVYRLVEVLGSGGMGRVYLAEHELLGRLVAIKVLRSAYARDPMVVKRFFAEARTVNQVAHENIVEITDFVDEADGTSFLVMEYLRGRPLSGALAQGPLGLRRAVGIARQIASALAAVHDIGIVHRDLKPDNVFLVDDPKREDFVKLLDFGAAKLNSTVVPGSVETQNVTLIGTPQYMSPEQATGAPVDGRSDIYALGVVLYEMITGGNPFRAIDAWSTIRNQVALSPASPDTVVAMVPPCPSLSSLIMACLEKEKEDRPDSMVEVEAVLARIASDLETPSGVFPPPPSAPRPAAAAPAPAAANSDPSTMMLQRAGVGPSPRRGLWGAVALGAVLAAAAAGFALSGGASGPSAAESMRAEPSGPPTASPAPSEAAAEAPAPAKTAAVTRVDLRSAPSGAEVVDGDGRVLGTTPFTARLTGPGPSRLTYRLGGYKPRTVAVDHGTAMAAVVSLEAAPRRRAAPRRVTTRRTPPKAAARPAPKPAAPAPAKTSKPRLQSKNAVIDPLLE